MPIVSVNGAELFYEVRGFGPSVLIIPGGGMDGVTFSRLAAILAREFESVCWLRERIGRFDSAGHDQWWDYGNPETSAGEIRSKLLTRVEPVLSQQGSRTGLIALWDAARGGDLGWRKEPRTPLGFALLLTQIGRNVDAGTIVQQLCEDSKGVPFHATVQVLAEDLGIPCGDDPDHRTHP